MLVEGHIAKESGDTVKQKTCKCIFC